MPTFTQLKVRLTQKQQAIDVLLGESQASASLTAIEARVAEKRQCPHCAIRQAQFHMAWGGDCAATGARPAGKPLT